ncbi:MAG TPA: 30S ribosomal protein S6 [Polyangiaceae bacterium]|nr:30S ribosomal protein S6 [Polyangiaceae bacterium]
MTATQATPMKAREYETIYVLRPDVPRESQERIAQRLTEVVSRESGKLTTIENWGRRQLAYTVSKYRRGVYVYLKYLGGGALVAEVERNLRMLDDVLKYQTVQIARDIDVAAVDVRPENVQFEAVEPATQEELAEPIERLLGLEQAPERERSNDGGEDLDGEEFEGEDLVANPDVAEDRS